MPRSDIIEICVENPIVRTPRVQQLEGVFDLPDEKISRSTWTVSMPIHERDWNIGLIVGPSGSGKTTIARHIFKDRIISDFQWSANRAIIDDFPKTMGIKEIISLLNSVGFSSPPSWLRPFRLLSNGEQFRVFMARVLAETRDMAVIDEFTSVVDRTVARIGSVALAKTIRRRNAKVIAISCHEDIEPWLQPDWVYRPAGNQFRWRSLRRRPSIKLEICRVHYSAWGIFARHHYLSAEINRSAVCFMVWIDGRPAAFHSYLPFFGRLSHGRAKRVHRSVCLPDFQGIGIGQSSNNYLSSMWHGLGWRVLIATSHPAFVVSMRRSREWKLIRAPSFVSKRGGDFVWLERTRASQRLTTSFEYIGAAMERRTARLLLGDGIF